MWAGMALGHEEAALLRTQLPPSLEAAGFTRYGEHCFMHEQEPHCVVEILALGVTPRAGVRRGAAVVATAGGVREEDLAEFVAMELAALRPAEFGKQLLEGISMMRHMAACCPALLQSLQVKTPAAPWSPPPRRLCLGTAGGRRQAAGSGG